MSPMIDLNNGVQIPQIGFGVYNLPGEQTQELVETALAAGYRHVDTAAAYYNEAGVGAAVRALGAREDVFVTTKVRNGEQGFEATLAAFENSRRELGLDYVDLYLVHWPVPSANLYVETYRALEKLLAEGAVRAIGVSNFLPEHLLRLALEVEHLPAINQIEEHPYFRDEATVAATLKLGAAVEAYSPLGRASVLDDPVLVRIAGEKGVTPAQVVLRWHIENGTIVIPKSATPERIRSNLDLWNFSLSTTELVEINSLNTGKRIGANPAEYAHNQFFQG